ncbi:hypothetical protein ACLKA7_012127 [Drosophila subpalustris]
MPWCSTGYGRDTMLQIRVWPGFCPRTTGSIPRLTTTVSRYYELAAGFLIPGLSPAADGMTLVSKYDRLHANSQRLFFSSLDHKVMSRSPHNSPQLALFTSELSLSHNEVKRRCVRQCCATDRKRMHACDGDRCF